MKFMDYLARILMVFICLQFLACRTPESVPLFVGTYTEAGGSQGIQYFQYNLVDGQVEFRRETESVNPSFLARSQDFLLAVNETTDGQQALSSFSITEQGLVAINSVPTGGAAPCHVVIADDGRYAVVSNYLGGVVDLFLLAPSGEILSKEDSKVYNGSSINNDRQESSHIHSAFFGPEGFLYVSDLGGDQIYRLEVLEENGELRFHEHDPIDVPAGSGPRHLAFHPDGNFFYALMELTGEVLTFSKSGHEWELIQQMDMNQEGFTGANGAADIKISSDGKFLYATNRGDANTVTCFQVGSQGKLNKMQVVSVVGKGPRNFNFSPDENFLLVGNQSTDEIVVLNRNRESGMLEDSGNRIDVFQPVCILF
ncbi:MAG: lactonase family protein [Sphingobacterium sp.]